MKEAPTYERAQPRKRPGAVRQRPIHNAQAQPTNGMMLLIERIRSWFLSCAIVSTFVRASAALRRSRFGELRIIGFAIREIGSPARLFMPINAKKTSAYTRRREGAIFIKTIFTIVDTSSPHAGSRAARYCRPHFSPS